MKSFVPTLLATMFCGLSLAQVPTPTPAVPSVPVNPVPPQPPPASTSPSKPSDPTAPETPPPPVDEGAVINAMLGGLANYMVAAISMDNEANGSMVMARPPARGQAIFSLKKRFGMDQGRRCADFSEPGTSLSLYGLELGPIWTLAMWVKFPLAGDDAVLWRSSGVYDFLCIQDGKFKSIQHQKKDDRTFGDYDKAWTGWHHVALTSDASINTLYIDGMVVGTVPASGHTMLQNVGGPWARPAYQRSDAATAGPPVNNQCSLLDDMFVFDKQLTPEELEKLALVRLPTHDLVTIPAPDPAPGAPPVATASLGISTEGSEQATALVKSYSNSLVFVSGEGAGSGFIADFGGKPFLVTNAHVAAGVRKAAFRTLQGATVDIGPGSVAMAHDICVMQSKSADNPMSVMRAVGENTAIGDEVVVLGNAEGGGVINTITGRIVGVGPNLVEVDAPFQPGNSGSPIIHLKTKKVIAVATYLTIRKYDTATRAPIKDPIIRRFGYRIDSVKTWQPVDWNAFYAQAAEMESIEQLTKDFITFILDIAHDSQVSRSRHTNPAIRTRIDAWLGSKGRRMSVQDSRNVDQNFISFLKVASQSDVTAAKQRISYDYFQRQLSEQQRERTEIATIFGKIVESVRSER